MMSITDRSLRQWAIGLTLTLILGGAGFPLLSDHAVAVVNDMPVGSGAQPPNGLPPEAKPPEYVPGEALVKFRKDVSPSEQAAIHDKVGAEVLITNAGLQWYQVRGKHGQSTEELIQAYSQYPQVQYVEPNGIFHTDILKPRVPQ